MSSLHPFPPFNGPPRPLPLPSLLLLIQRSHPQHPRPSLSINKHRSSLAPPQLKTHEAVIQEPAEQHNSDLDAASLLITFPRGLRSSGGVWGPGRVSALISEKQREKKDQEDKKFEEGKWEGNSKHSGFSYCKEI